ncbi:MAG: nickel pincer cofactor biosynthesis protein LarB [Planctomycetota bacterium]|nr:nickel pincer cofactor biosynthesis protein LarB [Planctomycetota bacterium]
MRREDVERLLEEVRRGDVDVAAAAGRLAEVMPVPGAGRLDGIAHLDHHRALRCGFPEVVLGSAKEPADLVEIAHAILARADTLLVTRVDEVRAGALTAALPDAEHHVRARAVTVRRATPVEGRSGILILTAGTGDVPVAEEARVTAESMGQAPEVIHDVGGAGIHRFLGQQERLRAARVVVVAAGMDGALPSVVAGLVGVPVIAVPTSVGYGTALDGLAPLLSMMNACAPNVAVVNVDNGFGAGYLAALINAQPRD